MFQDTSKERERIVEILMEGRVPSFLKGDVLSS